MNKVSTLFVFMALAMSASADGFKDSCSKVMKDRPGPGGDALCSCVAGKLKADDNGSEILKVLSTPRPERRQAFQSLSDDSRQTLFSCMRTAGGGQRGSQPGN
jgi:hypothetical protein